jgi:ComF family protein
LAIDRLPGPGCRVCGAPLEGFLGVSRPDDGRRCGACRLTPPAFSYARTAARYGDTVRLAVHALKFRGRRALAAPLGDLLAEIDPATLPVPAPDLIVPVPLHARRQRERGFNQAVLLARRLGRGWGVPVESRVLARRRATAPQTDLPAAARRGNVRGAFSARHPGWVAGRHVVLVDDVFTTGSTVDACARCLLDAGATAVGVLTVARVI